MDKAVERERAIAWLTQKNPRASKAAIHQYVDAWFDYREAQANIATHGAVVAHPRNGSPIENPYIKVRASATTAMQRANLRHVDGLWEPK